MQVKHPEIHVRLVGEDGNAFAILGRCQNAMRKARLSKEEMNAFTKEATSGNYDHLLATCIDWFDCDGDEEEEEDDDA